MCHRTLNFSRNLAHNGGRRDRHLSGRGELALQSKLIALSILSVLVVSAVGSGASAEARRTSLADEMDSASNVRGGAAVLADLAGERKPSDLGGWYDTVSN